MIGGYLYHRVDEEQYRRVFQEVDGRLQVLRVKDRGLLFHDEPFPKSPTTSYVSEYLTVLTQDILVTLDAGGEYETLPLNAAFAERFQHSGIEFLDGISSDFRIAIVEQKPDGDTLYLTSHRAGAGRIYYRKLASGILFSSDLRFLLRMGPVDIDERAIYGLLKYGAIPEPMTPCRDIQALPPAHYLQYDCNRNALTSAPYFKLAFDEGASSAEDPLAALGPAKSALLKSARYLRRSSPVILLSGGIDSSLYCCYLRSAGQGSIRGINCTFGTKDPEFPFAERIAEQTGAELHIGAMKKEEALDILEDVVALTDHPFSDFSSLPVVFILKFIRANLDEAEMLIECNGGDDCFGFPALGEQGKSIAKGKVPRFLKRAIAGLFSAGSYWKWESREGFLARVAAIADAHEQDPSNYFLVSPPVHYVGLGGHDRWDREIGDLMNQVFASCSENFQGLSYQGVTTVKQLIHVNSRRWAAKALSAGEGLGIRCIYPYIWKEILIEQGKLPWNLKIRRGVVKWPLKRLLEEFMPRDFIYRKKSGFVPPFAGWIATDDFNQIARETLLSRNGVITGLVPAKVIDTLLSDALAGRRLRHPILNFLWGALFTELWLKEQGLHP